MNSSRQTRCALLASTLLCAFAFGSRASGNAPTGRYVVSNGTVYDTKTKLTWEQAPAMDSYASLAVAVTHCAGLSLPGSGWRVPKVSELLTIVDVSRQLPAIDTNVFMNTYNQGYFTSTPFVDPDSPDYTFYVHFGDGITSYNEPSSARVRCVR